MAELRFEALGQRVREAQREQLEAEETLERARDRFDPALARAPQRVYARAAVLAAASFAVAAAILLLLRPPSPLGFQTAGQPGVPEAWIAVPVDGRQTLDFSDGTQIELHAKTRARVSDVTPEGASLVVEKGGATLHVIPRSGARWDVRLGPFQVTVTGTVFDATWDPANEEVVVSVTEGSVRVEGPRLGSGRAVRAGETLRASAREPAARARTPQTTSTQKSSSLESEPTPEPTRGGVAVSEPTWADLLASGDYKAAMAAAEKAGFDELCESAGPAQLLKLGDVARYSGNGARARQAYQALRRRFPGSGPAGRAAFALGKMAFDQQGSYAAAASWFSTYLGEQPGGPLAREAAGRLMESKRRMGDLAGARVAAEQYLARHASGPHAGLAREIVEEGESGEPDPEL